MAVVMMASAVVVMVIRHTFYEMRYLTIPHGQFSDIADLHTIVKSHPPYPGH